jgi:uncharacterized protein
MEKNVFGEPLVLCSEQPMTGYFRDGCCRTEASDSGLHVVCAQMTEAFLTFSKSVGNDLSTPYPRYNFPGLQAGDFWCLCASRWLEAKEAGLAPKIKLEACHEKILDFIPLKELVKYALK